MYIPRVWELWHPMRTRRKCETLIHCYNDHFTVWARGGPYTLYYDIEKNLDNLCREFTRETLRGIRLTVKAAYGDCPDVEDFKKAWEVVNTLTTLYGVLCETWW